ncbi:MAG: hypothetical protein WC816_05760 [Sphingomonas sp.]|jgi:hypothetical protein
MESLILLAAMAGTPENCPPTPPRGMVARSTSFGGVIAPTVADADDAVTAGTVAQRAARRFLGLDAPPFLIAAASPATTTPLGGCAFLFPWPFPQPREGAARLPTHVLPHEIGHALFIRYLVPKTRSDEYGGDAPDWLDEMAALAFEDAAGVRLRRRDTWRHTGRGALIPLSRLLSMPHPEWSARSIAPGPPTESATHQPRSVDTPAFYATVRALFDFLIDRTGDEQIVRLLAEQVRAGVPLDQWLLAHAARGGSPEGLATLDAEIVTFVMANPVYAEASKDGPVEE